MVNESEPEVDIHGSDPDAARASASIWARAKDRRDGSPNGSSDEDALHGVQRRLRLHGSQLLLARQGGAAVGFALFAPNDTAVELYYLAVDPDAWGAGVAHRLLRRVATDALAAGAAAVELWVIDDNQRAIDVYERSGWVPTKQTRRDRPSSREERRFV